MYGAGALVWEAEERNRLENEQMAFGRWLWRVQQSVRNAAVHGESGWSTFAEREAKAKMGLLCRIFKYEGLMTDVGRGVLLELGMKSNWWRVINKIACDHDFEGIYYMLRYRRISPRGARLARISIKMIQQIQTPVLQMEIGRRAHERWKRSLDGTERTVRYSEKKETMKMERYADGGDGARVRLMARGDSLMVRACPNLSWMYEDEEKRRCVCGMEENERHVLLHCQLYDLCRMDWLRVWANEMGKEDPMDGVLGFVRMPEHIERLTLKTIGKIWRERSRVEEGRAQ